MTSQNSLITKNSSFLLILSLILSISAKFTYTMENNPSKTVYWQNFLNQSLAMMASIIKTYIKDPSSYLKEKIPTKMQNSFYWKNSFINGFKINTAFALLATFAYPLNIVSGKKAILLQTLFIIKNIICLRMFSNNQESNYFITTAQLVDLKETLHDNGNYLNNIIGPYSFILLGFGLSYAGFKEIKSFANKTNIRALVFNHSM